jgi:hypothetical protein
VTCEGHSFDVFQPENDPALSAHAYFSLRAARRATEGRRQLA